MPFMRVLYALALAAAIEKNIACQALCQDRQAISGHFIRDEKDRPVRVCGCVYEKEAHLPHKEKKGLTPIPTRTINAQDFYTPGPIEEY